MNENESQIPGLSSLIQNVALNYGSIVGSLSVVVRPSIPPEPPGLNIIKAYLDATKAETKPELPTATDGSLEVFLQPKALSKETVDKLGKLWHMLFRAHRAGEPPKPLKKVVTDVLDEDQQSKGYQRLVLLADVGMGKTPALKSLMAKTAACSSAYLEGLPDSEKPRPDACSIPIFINLVRLQANQSLVNMVCDAFNAHVTEKISTDQALGILASGDFRCLILLDDLDQLLSQRAQGAFQTLCQFMETYHEHRYVVSCRTSNYRQQLGFLDVLFLDELQPKQVVKIIGSSQYKELVRTSKRLAHNRAAIEQYLRNDGSAGLLQTKGFFLQKLIQTRLDANADKFTDHNIDIAVVRGLLQSLAIRMRFDRTQAYSERQLMLLITDYLQEWRETTPWRQVAATLAECEMLDHDQVKNLWRFCDRCDEAYFAASAVIDDPAKLESLLREASDFWWRDVFEILVGIYQDPQGLLIDLIDRDVFVASDCVRHVAEPVGQVCQEALVDALVEEFWKESSTRKTYILERLGESDHPRVGQALLLILHREWSSMVLMAALKALAAWGNRQADSTKAICDAEKLISHSLGGSVGSIGELLGWCWSDQPRDDWTQQIKSLQDTKIPVRSRALVALGLGMRHIDEACGTLLELLKAEDTSDMVAWCALEAVALLKSREEVQTWAKTTAKGEESNPEPLQHQHRRARAVYLLGRFGGDSDTEKLLCRALIDQQSAYVRGYAVSGMARLDLIDARTEIEKLVMIETDPSVLRQAAEALGQIGTLESLPVLQRQLRNPQVSTRRIVRRAINEILERNALQPLIMIRP